MAHVTSKTTDKDAWSSYWLNRPMPVLESTKTSLQQMLRRADRVRATDVAQVVLADPLLMLQALRFIGRRERTSMAAEVVSIENIVMLMGVAPFLERFSLLPTVESVLQPNSAGLAAFMQQTMLARLSARLAQAYADMRYDARIDEVVTAALLSRCRELLELVGSKQDSALPQPDSDIALFLARQGMAQSVVSLLDDHDSTSSRVVLQRAVLRLSHALQSGWWWQSVQKELDLIAEVLEISPEVVWRTLCRIMLASAQDPAALPSLQHPARWLAMLPGDWPIAPANEVQTAKVAEMKVQPDPLAAHMQSLHLAGKQQIETREIMALAVRALTVGLGMRRMVFVLLTPGSPELRTRFVMGWAQNHPIRQLKIRTDAADLIASLLEKPQGLWLNADNVVQYRAHIPEAIHQAFASESFCMMSIFAGSKPIGLILVDRGENEPIAAHHYQHFKRICLLTTQALTYNASP